MRGRKPKPTAQRRFEGNPGKRRLNPAEPVPPPLADPPPASASVEAVDVPEELLGNALAVKEWTRLLPMLRGLRLVTEADRSVLIALCIEWARYVDATRRSSQHGMLFRTASGYPVPNPYIGIASKALAGCVKLWPELGLTPSARSRLSTPGSGLRGEEVSEFDVPLALTPPRPN